MLIHLIASLALSLSAFAKGAPGRNPGLDEFMAFCRNHHQELELEPFKPPKVGETVFVPTPNLVNNQSRFSFAAVIRKIDQMFGDEGKAYAQKKKGEWRFNYDDGRSAFPARKAIRGIFDRGRVYIVDGHHRALISTYLGSQTIPVHIIGDISRAKYSFDQVRAYMERNEYSFFRNFRGGLTKPVDLCDMIDDPNLELARLLIGRIDVDIVKGKAVFSNPRGGDLVIGVKTEMDIPFFEFYIADALRRAGVEWDNGNSCALEKCDLKSYLSILRDAAARNPNSPLRKVFLFEKPKRMADLDLRDSRLAEHVHNLDCEGLLTVH